MRTIFITLFQGVEAKNILRTNIYRKLIENPDVRIVFFVGSQAKAEYYQKEFHHPNVVYEVVEHWKINSWWENIFSFLKFRLVNTETMDLRRKIAYRNNQQLWIYYVFMYLFNRIFARQVVRKTVRWLDYRLVRPSGLEEYFDRYKPDTVFLAHLFDDLEIAMLREAKCRGVCTIGFVNSWDKLTARCMMRLLPNKLLVYNEVVKQEAIDADMKECDVVIVGIPQYDQYVNSKPSSREEFYRRIGIDQYKRILLYAPTGRYFSNSDWDMIDLLRRFQEQLLLPLDTEMLVRFQPNDFVDGAELKKRPWLHYNLPGVRFSQKRGVDWDMNFQDLQHLLDTLHYSSMLICTTSSIAVDMAIFNKPIINLNFELKERQRLSETPTYFYQMTHYKKALSTGGIRLVHSPQELVEWIGHYLADPGLDAEGRKRLVTQQCWKLDGQAGRRIATAIIDG